MTERSEYDFFDELVIEDPEALKTIQNSMLEMGVSNASVTVVGVAQNSIRPVEFTNLQDGTHRFFRAKKYGTNSVSIRLGQEEGNQGQVDYYTQVLGKKY